MYQSSQKLTRITKSDLQVNSMTRIKYAILLILISLWLLTITTLTASYSGVLFGVYINNHSEPYVRSDEDVINNKDMQTMGCNILDGMQKYYNESGNFHIYEALKSKCDNKCLYVNYLMRINKSKEFDETYFHCMDRIINGKLVSFSNYFFSRLVLTGNQHLPQLTVMRDKYFPNYIVYGMAKRHSHSGIITYAYVSNVLNNI